jgi:alanyl-tRNA synthetase
MELCGGTHVARTGEIGLLKVVSEGASSAGIRRVEALTGAAAFDYLEGQEQALAKVASALRTRPADAADRVQALLDERKALQSELAGLKRQIALGDIGNVKGKTAAVGQSIAAAVGMAAGTGAGTATGTDAAKPEAKEINGMKFFARSFAGVSPKDLRGLIDEYKSRLGSGAVLLIAETDGKAAIAAGVTEDLTARISAVDLVRAAVEAVGGKGGGGRPDMAQGGGPDASKAAAAIQAAEAVLAG